MWKRMFASIIKLERQPIIQKAGLYNICVFNARCMRLEGAQSYFPFLPLQLASKKETNAKMN